MAKGARASHPMTKPRLLAMEVNERAFAVRCQDVPTRLIGGEVCVHMIPRRGFHKLSPCVKTESSARSVK